MFNIKYHLVLAGTGKRGFESVAITIRKSFEKSTKDRG
jgi:hypothetical protein